MSIKKLGYMLLVDDSANDVALAKRALERQKLVNEIVTLRDGAEALDFLFCRGSFSAREKRLPLFVLLDIKMPKVDGIEVLRIIKSDPGLRLIPVVMMTSSRQPLDIEECYRLNANAFVVKPVDFDQLVEVVTNIGKFWAVINEAPPLARSTDKASAGPLDRRTSDQTDDPKGEMWVDPGHV
jgi:CheY-like chemotaxis protein